MPRLSTKTATSPSPELGELFSFDQLARLSKVSPPRLRAWIRRKLLRPAARHDETEYFDFVQLAMARRLQEITRAGIDPADIARFVEAVRHTMPQLTNPLAELEVSPDGRLVVRLENGLEVSGSGQLHLDLALESDPGAEPAPEPAPETVSVHDDEGWFERAIALEEAGDLDQAATCYEKALEEGEPSAEAAFNLGNVLYALDRADEALAHYAQAIDLDPEYVEAWHNLASVQAELEHWADAIEAGRHALQLAPGYPDTHYNLAEAHFGCGDLDSARHHGRIYLSYDASSEWAQRLRAKLGL